MKFNKESYNVMYYRKKPWLKSFYNARRRCSPEGGYFGKGIKFLMTKEDFEWLWGRDRAWLMKKPSIHRINPDGNYTRDNCAFIEHYENVTQSKRIGRKSKFVDIYGLSVRGVSGKLGISKTKFYRLHKENKIRQALESMRKEP